MIAKRPKTVILAVIMCFILIIAIGAVTFTGAMTASASNKTILQKATGLLDEPSDLVEEVLRNNNISYTTVNISNNLIMAGGDPHWQTYDLVCADGVTYVIILRKSLDDESYDDFAAILDHDGRLIYGLIDNGVTPALFENGVYIFEETPSDSDVVHSDVLPDNETARPIQAVILDARSEFGNDDIVGYLDIPDTSIQYYFTQAKDNEFYMGHDIYKNSNGSGWIFLDYENDISHIDKNIILYGHNPEDEIMFHGLRSYLTEDYARSHRYFYLTTQYWNSGYEVFAVLLTDVSFDYNRALIDNSQFSSILDTMNKESLYDFGVEVTTNDRILTLSTYLNPNDRDDPSRLIVVGKLMGSAELLSAIPLSDKAINAPTSTLAATAESETASSSERMVSGAASQLAYGQRIPNFFALNTDWTSDFMIEAYNNNFFVTLDEPIVSNSNGLTMALTRYILTGERTEFLFKVSGLPEGKMSTKFNTETGAYTSNNGYSYVNISLKLKDGNGKTIFNSNSDLSLIGFSYETSEGEFLDIAVGEKNNSNWGDHALEIPDILNIEIDGITLGVGSDAYTAGGQWTFSLPVDDMFKNVKPLYYEVTNPDYCNENGIYVDKFYSTATATRMELTIDTNKNSVELPTGDLAFFLFEDKNNHFYKRPYEQKLFVEADGVQLFETAAYIPYEGYEGERSDTLTKFVSEYYWPQPTEKGMKYFIYLPTLHFSKAENIVVRVLDENRKPLEVNLRLQ